MNANLGSNISYFTHILLSLGMQNYICMGFITLLSIFLGEELKMEGE
jgi:hypothetical protein